MDEISPKSYRLLKKLKRHKGYFEILPTNEDIEFIRKYIHPECTGYDSYNAPIYSNRYKIAASGKNQLRLHSAAMLEKWIPYIITTCVAIAALAISLIALSTQQLPR